MPTLKSRVRCVGENLARMFHNDTATFVLLFDEERDRKEDGFVQARLLSSSLVIYPSDRFYVLQHAAEVALADQADGHFAVDVQQAKSAKLCLEVLQSQTWRNLMQVVSCLDNDHKTHMMGLPGHNGKDCCSDPGSQQDSGAADFRV